MSTFSIGLLKAEITITELDENNKIKKKRVVSLYPINYTPLYEVYDAI